MKNEKDICPIQLAFENEQLHKMTLELKLLLLLAVRSILKHKGKKISFKQDKPIFDLIEYMYQGGDDIGHGTEHILAVLNSAQDIKAGTKGQTLEPEEILACIFHDAIMSDRKKHEINSADFFQKLWLEFIKWYGQKADKEDGFTKTELSELKKIQHFKVFQAIREHRASYKGKHSSYVSELISAADRGKPGNLKTCIERSFTFGQNKLGIKDRREAAQHAYDHIKDKYSRTGYAMFTKPYKEYYKDKIEAMYKEIDNLTIDDVLEVVKGV